VADGSDKSSTQTNLIWHLQNSTTHCPASKSSMHHNMSPTPLESRCHHAKGSWLRCIAQAPAKHKHSTDFISVATATATAMMQAIHLLLLLWEYPDLLFVSTKSCWDFTLLEIAEQHCTAQAGYCHHA
jgi:hypothetical protein